VAAGREINKQLSIEEEPILLVAGISVGRLIAAKDSCAVVVVRSLGDAGEADIFKSYQDNPQFLEKFVFGSDDPRQSCLPGNGDPRSSNEKTEFATTAAGARLMPGRGPGTRCTTCRTLTSTALSAGALSAG
jgi:hypothetical protein